MDNNLGRSPNNKRNKDKSTLKGPILQQILLLRNAIFQNILANQAANIESENNAISQRTENIVSEKDAIQSQNNEIGSEENIALQNNVIRSENIASQNNDIQSEDIALQDQEAEMRESWFSYLFNDLNQNPNEGESTAVSSGATPQNSQESEQLSISLLPPNGSMTESVLVLNNAISQNLDVFDNGQVPDTHLSQNIPVDQSVATSSRHWSLYLKLDENGQVVNTLDQKKETCQGDETSRRDSLQSNVSESLDCNNDFKNFDIETRPAEDISDLQGIDAIREFNLLVHTHRLF